jgi:hypothetical protein
MSLQKLFIQNWKEADNLGQNVSKKSINNHHQGTAYTGFFYVLTTFLCSCQILSNDALKLFKAAKVLIAVQTISLEIAEMRVGKHQCTS